MKKKKMDFLLAVSMTFLQRSRIRGFIVMFARSRLKTLSEFMLNEKPLWILFLGKLNLSLYLCNFMHLHPRNGHLASSHDIDITTFSLK